MKENHRDKHEIWAEILMFLDQPGFWVGSTRIYYNCNLNSKIWKKMYSPVLINLRLIEQSNFTKGYRLTPKGKAWLEVWKNLRLIEREGL